MIFAQGIISSSSRWISELTLSWSNRAIPVLLDAAADRTTAWQTPRSCTRDSVFGRLVSQLERQRDLFKVRFYFSHGIKAAIYSHLQGLDMVTQSSEEADMTWTCIFHITSSCPHHLAISRLEGNITHMYTSTILPKTWKFGCIKAGEPQQMVWFPFIDNGQTLEYLSPKKSELFY